MLNTIKDYMAMILAGTLVFGSYAMSKEMSKLSAEKTEIRYNPDILFKNSSLKE